MSTATLERFTDELLALRARRIAPVLSADESALFVIINRTLGETERTRLAALSEKRADEALTLEEHQELIFACHANEGFGKFGSTSRNTTDRYDGTTWHSIS